MKWFLERISTSSLPVHFGIKEQTEHLEDFNKLVQKKILVHTSNLDNVNCDFCEADESHECQVRNDKGKLYYICDNGNGKKKLTDKDVAIFEYDNLSFLKLITEELGIQAYSGSPRDEALYSDNAFFRLGTYKNKRVKAEVFYLRNSDNFEPSLHFGEIGNEPKVLITNTIRADVVFGKENLSYAVLNEILSSEKNKFLDEKKFEECFDKVRRVRFDKSGNLFLDEIRIYTASLNSPEFYFLSYLWKNWEKQMPHDAIHKYIKDETSKDTSDPAQKFCQKIKSKIKSSAELIDKIITNPTVGHYMMADPL